MSLLWPFRAAFLLTFLPLAVFANSPFPQDSIQGRQKVEGLIKEASAYSVNQPLKSIQTLEEALSNARKYKLENLELDLLFLIGQTQINLGNFQAGREMLNQALQQQAIQYNSEKKSKLFLSHWS